jgi:ubiquinone/menaquinone biosynthesis C-methylase UbiE
MNEDKISRDIERLRDPQRLALLETERVVSLCLQGPKFEKVLDIGTGSGVFAEVFTHSGLNVTGIDLQEPMLEAARRFVPKAHFQMADSKSLPFGNDSFDLCFLGLVLHEAGRPLRTLQEARRVCTMRAAVLEWSYTEQNFGPPLKERLKSDEVLRMGNSSGFSQIKTIPLEHLILFLLEK